ncbi:hypothetical protein MMC07_006462 [Pseudocyphellaria aurata]|nr:hypothetical protein [Pseudocyphellaria aurata]
MEGIHGVDVSWLHHSPKDHHVQNAVSSSATTEDVQEEQAVMGSQEHHDKNNVPSSTQANETSTAQGHHHLHRPHILNRATSEKMFSSPQPVPKSIKDNKPSSAGSPARRNSWMSSLSSKFTSTSNPPSNGSVPAASPTTKKATSPALEQPNPFGAAFTPGTREPKKQEPITAQNSPSPKSGHPSFLQSALRRLSSSGPGNMGKMTGTGGVCERKTMNIDPHRPRCAILDLEPAKLRRVAFCVDVEIAAPAKYTEDDEESPPPPGRRPSLTQLENQIDVKKRKDMKFKKSEGEALKNPNTVVEEKDDDGVGAIEVAGERVQPEISILSPTEATVETEGKDPTKKKEKKRRSEEERKERKERRRQEALANGTVPAELQRGASSGSATETPEGARTPPKSQARPTTDPLRIYRRCCQLRESPILKRITEQIASPSACPAETPGILSVLDLSNYWMQLPDLITLSDYLAVVPVRKLVLENCGLGDEAVRVVLAGLLAAKTAEQAKHNKRLGRNADRRSQEKTEQFGAIQKLSLKNNPKIGREGWRHIALFINMSKSLKAIDLSMIPFPETPMSPNGSNSLTRSPRNSKLSTDIPALLQKAISERLGGSDLEELVMAECGLKSDSIGKIVDGVSRCGVTRLGLASNGLTQEGLEHVLRYLQTGKCRGLDLGGNNLRECTKLLAESLDENNALYALSLADCKLSPLSLEYLLPALVRLPNFRFIDLSHNQDLFTTKPSALGLLRRYIPQFPILKRIHLLDVAMSSEQAIALAEVLPESRSLAHLNILENQPLSDLALATDEASQEEACALYASLMVAVRVSSTIICIDIDVPGDDSSEVVKALAKQVVAYSLRNLERTPLGESNETAAAVPIDSQVTEKEVHVPDILMHLVGHIDGVADNHDNDEPAPDDDYIVGGTGVVKALGVCLNRAADLRKSRSGGGGDSGSVTPRKTLQGSEETKGKAKEMSKDLLGSARKIRARLLPALVKEAKSGDAMSYKRLQFLDSTLERMIQRFENEYPETRLQPSPQSYQPPLSNNAAFSTTNHPPTDSDTTNTEALDPDPDSEPDEAIRIPVLRQGSEASLASRQAQEEGRMHKFGQRIRRDILRPETLDYSHGTTGKEVEESHLKELRRKLEALNGAEIRDKVHGLGPEAAFEAIGATVEELRALEMEDPDGYQEARNAAMRNMEDNAPESRNCA